MMKQDKKDFAFYFIILSLIILRLYLYLIFTLGSLYRQILNDIRIKS